jgi:iron(III) transport system substrate-binding protein
MVMYDPTRPGTANGMLAFLNGIWGTEKMTEWLKGLAKQEPVVTRESRTPLEGVARGKYAIGIAMRNEVIPEFLKIGAPVAAVKAAEGGQLGPGAGCLGIVKKRPHPNAAQLFVNWLLTQEGMTVWSKGDGYATARKDVSTAWVPNIFLPGPGENVWFESEEGIHFRSTLMKIAREVFGPLMKKK